MTPDETRKMEERLSFKEFVIVVANIESDDYSNLGNLPAKARELLLSEPPELDPWDLLNQAQAEQQRLESLLTSRDAEIERARELSRCFMAYSYHACFHKNQDCNCGAERDELLAKCDEANRKFINSQAAQPKDGTKVHDVNEFYQDTPARTEMLERIKHMLLDHRSTHEILQEIEEALALMKGKEKG